MYTGLDFLAPFDCSGYNSLTPTQLASLVGGIDVNTAAGIGCVIMTQDVAGVPSVPSVATYPKLANFPWLRIGALNATLYVWNPNGAIDPTLLQWQVANINSITTGSITGSQIAALTITDSNIASVGWPKLPAGAAVGGCLVGSMPDPALGNSVVSLVNLNLASLGSGVANQLLISQGANLEWLTSILVPQSITLEAGIANSKLQTVQVNSAGNNYQYSTHNVLQIASGQSTTIQTTATVVAALTAMTTVNSVLYAHLGNAGSIAFTPLSTSSTVVIEMDVFGALSAGSPSGINLAMMVGGVNVSQIPVPFGGFGVCQGRLVYSFQPASTSTLAIALYFAATSTGTAEIFGITNAVMYKITEYI